MDEMILVRFVWENCRLCGGRDAFWLEATIRGAELHIFPLLNEALIEESKKLSEEAGMMAKRMGRPERTCCFLASRDLDCIRPFAPHYPVHHMWNAYSPFREIPEVEIAGIHEVTQIQV